MGIFPILLWLSSLVDQIPGRSLVSVSGILEEYLFFFLMMLVHYFKAQEYEFKMKRALENVTDEFGTQDKAHKLPFENHKQDLKAPYLFTGFFSKPHIQVQ